MPEVAELIETPKSVKPVEKKKRQPSKYAILNATQDESGIDRQPVLFASGFKTVKAAENAIIDQEVVGTFIIVCIRKTVTAKMQTMFKLEGA